MIARQHRILFVGTNCYLDDSNGAAVSSRALLELLASKGFQTEALTGVAFESGGDVDIGDWLRKRDLAFEVVGGGSWTVSAHGVQSPLWPCQRLTVRGVSVSLYGGPSTWVDRPDRSNAHELLGLFQESLSRFRPDVVINFGGDALAHEVRRRARGSGCFVVFPLHNFNYTSVDTFQDCDQVFVPSRFAYDHYRRALGLECTVLSNLIDHERVQVTDSEPGYVTFVNPSLEKGVFLFIRIADELGRRRPDIPILVVESRGSESTLVGCGVDLRPHGNVFLMAPTHDPRDFWRVTRVCLLPSLWWENQPLVAVEAMINGIPVIGSDRGGIPETLGEAGIVLPIPQRLTPHTRELPSAVEVAPWVEAIVRLWDDAEFYREHQARALAESRRWDADVLEPRYVRFFEEIAGRARR